MARRRPEAWRTGYSIRTSGGGITAATVFGNEWFFNSTAARHGSGKNPDEPSTDFDTILGGLQSNDVVYVSGDIRAQAVAPLGVYGVKIIGAVGGRPRHTTSDGVVLTGNGVAWREKATAAGAPLIELREQGWEVHNILMMPESGYSAVKLHRAESATYPDASHFIARNVKFISSGTQVGYGLEDVGGAYHVMVEECEFWNLEYGWKQTSVGVDSPTSHEWRRNRFRGNKNDITMNAKYGLFEWNHFGDKYNASTHPNTLNLAFTGSGGTNRVSFNSFADAAADVVIAKGYKPSTGDVWRNFVTDAADAVVAVPA